MAGLSVQVAVLIGNIDTAFYQSATGMYISPFKISTLYLAFVSRVPRSKSALSAYGVKAMSFMVHDVEVFSSFDLGLIQRKSLTPGRRVRLEKFGWSINSPTFMEH